MCFFLKVLFMFLCLYLVNTDEINNLVFKYKYRHIRHCKKIDEELQPFYRENILESPLYLIFLILLGLILILMFLGIIKGLIGLFLVKKVGEFGMGLLVDLPKPLDNYQEKEIAQRPVIYDVGGWPVHPDTKRRTVRALSKKTEFCLNTIFFIAYPLALILQLCALCCCIKNYSDETNCFKTINIVKFNEGITKKDRYQTPGQKIDMYKDNDVKEEEDTKYVINMMKQSQISLLKQG